MNPPTNHQPTNPSTHQPYPTINEPSHASTEPHVLPRTLRPGVPGLDLTGSAAGGSGSGAARCHGPRCDLDLENPSADFKFFCWGPFKSAYTKDIINMYVKLCIVYVMYCIHYDLYTLYMYIVMSVHLCVYTVYTCWCSSFFRFSHQRPWVPWFFA